MPTAIEDVLESATNGVLRALDARRAGSQGSTLDTVALVRSGFFVDVHIRCGGFPPFPPGSSPATEVALNPQPLPPGEQ
jgi:hypothetical protein